MTREEVAQWNREDEARMDAEVLERCKNTPPIGITEVALFHRAAIRRIEAQKREIERLTKGMVAVGEIIQ